MTAPAKACPRTLRFTPIRILSRAEPTAPGTYPVVITVEDSADPQHTASANFTLTVEAAK